MKKSIILPAIIFCLSVFITIESNAQMQADSLSINKNNDSIQKNKLKFGLGFGVNFVGGTNLNLAPNLTYQLTEKLSLGGGLQFNYASLKNIQTTTTIGANALVFYKPLKSFLTTIEFSEMYVSRNSITTNTKDKFWEAALFLGAGIEINSKIAIGAKYNVLYDKNNSIYASPIVPFVNISF